MTVNNRHALPAAPCSDERTYHMPSDQEILDYFIELELGCAGADDSFRRVAAASLQTPAPDSKSNVAQDSKAEQSAASSDLTPGLVQDALTVDKAGGKHVDSHHGRRKFVPRPVISRRDFASSIW